jgi:hypothetical protein
MTFAGCEWTCGNYLSSVAVDPEGENFVKHRLAPTDQATVRRCSPADGANSLSEAGPTSVDG